MSVVGLVGVGSGDVLMWFRRLHLPNEIVPATHKRAARPPRPATVRPGAGEAGAPRPPRGDQEGYRRKEGGAPGDYRASFAGVGRGGP